MNSGASVKGIVARSPPWLLLLLLLVPLSFTHAEPVITVTPSSLSFSGEVYSAVAPQTIAIANSGDGKLNYTIRSDMFWLSVDNPSGTLAAGEATTHVVRVATRGLAPRVYPGRLTMTESAAANSLRVVTVRCCIATLSSPSLVAAWGRNDYGQTNVPVGLTNAVAVEGGASHSLALRADGRVVAWGKSSTGQTNVPAGLTNAVALDACGYHSLALRSDGRVVAWGNGYSVPPWLTNVVAVADGESHSLALRGDGSVVAWGSNNSGQTNVPAWLTNAVAVGGGGYHSLALRGDGSVVVWGSNNFGQTNVPTWLTNAVAVAGGGVHSLALRADGSVVVWGDNRSGQTNVPTGLTNVVAVSGGGYHSLALRADGTVVGWGYNVSGQTNAPAGLMSAATVACGQDHSLTLVPASPLTVNSFCGSPVPGRGTNWVMRRNLQACWVDPVVQIYGSTQYVCIGWTGNGSVPDAGTSNRISFVITNESSITWLWATNYWLETRAWGGGSVTPDSGWCVPGSAVTLSASNWPGYAFLGWSGDTNGCAIGGTEMTASMTKPRRIEAQFTGPAIAVVPPDLTFSGEVYGAIATQIIAITNPSVEVLHYTVRSDVFWLSVDTPAGMLAAGAGTTHVVRVTTRGLAPRVYHGTLTINDPAATTGSQIVTASLGLSSVCPPSMVMAWGDNSDGQTDVPAGLTNAVAVANGWVYSLALRADGTVVGWGVGPSVPVGLTNAVAVAGGGYHSLALRADGRVMGWGDNSFGQTSVPEGLTNAVAVAAGEAHSLALRVDGTVMAWGNNDLGATTAAAGLTDAVAVACGWAHSLALRADGSVVAWGLNNFGQANVPEWLTNAAAIAGGYGHSLALRADGGVVSWGLGQAAVPAGLTDAVAIAAGDDYSLALRADGTIMAWGYNGYGQTVVPAGLTNAVALAASEGHVLALVPAAQMTVMSPYASPVPATGTSWVIRRSSQACWVDPVVQVQGATQYVSIGWAGSGSVPADGASNRVSFVITNDSSITWFWGTNYWVDVSAESHGSAAPTSGWFAAGANPAMQASADPYYHFTSWTGTVASTSNPLSVLVLKPEDVRARFAANLATNDTPEWWLARHGATNRDCDVEALDDQDGDGVPTWCEWVSDTDPTDSNSLLRIMSIAPDAGGVRVFWRGGTSVLQCLERRQDLGLTNDLWTVIFSNTPPTGVFTNRLDGQGTNDTRFYRIRVVR